MTALMFGQTTTGSQPLHAPVVLTRKTVPPVQEARAMKQIASLSQTHGKKFLALTQLLAHQPQPQRPTKGHSKNAKELQLAPVGMDLLAMTELQVVQTDTQRRKSVRGSLVSPGVATQTLGAHIPWMLQDPLACAMPILPTEAPPLQI